MCKFLIADTEKRMIRAGGDLIIRCSQHCGKKQITQGGKAVRGASAEGSYTLARHL